MMEEVSVALALALHSEAEAVGVQNNNKRKESTRVKEVCSNFQFFFAKQVHFHLASRLSKSRVKTRNRKVNKALGNGQPEGHQERIRLASRNRNLKTGRKPGTGRVWGNGSNRRTGSSLAPVHRE